MLLYIEKNPILTVLLGYITIVVFILITIFLLFKIKQALENLKKFKKSRNEIFKKLEI